MKRREFLQRTGWAVAGYWLGTSLWSSQIERYGSALAETSSRKFALLVGINQYGAGLSLNGCLTDVELQRQLLIHRFGLTPANILTLTDAQATRKNIIAAFMELRENVKPGDTVVFHFSGYGRTVVEDSEGENRQLRNVLMPVDGKIAPASAENDLSEQGVLWLLNSLPTQNVLAVLDTSYAYLGSPIKGYLRVRSCPEVVSSISNLSADLPSNFKQVKSGHKVVVYGAGPQQLAWEMQMNGWSCGSFTYALTQTLWQEIEAKNLVFILKKVGIKINHLVGIDPEPELIKIGFKQGKNVVKTDNLPFNKLSADGVILEADTENKTAQVWLGGLPAQVLDIYGVNSVLAVNGTPALVVRSLKGPLAKAQVLTDVQKGDLVREWIRVLPANINLMVGLDSSLERIERVDATSAFAGVGNVVPVVTLDLPMDYLFGRWRDTLIAQAPNTLPTVSKTSYGLFSIAQDLIPNTVGEGGEAVKSAVLRLTPEFQTLLAVKWWRLLINNHSSLLDVRATIEKVENNRSQILLEQGIGQQSVPERFYTEIPKGSQLQYRLYNQTGEDIYYIILGLDNRGQVFASLFETVEQTKIAAGESALLPAITSSGALAMGGEAGLTEIQFICCRQPLTKTVAQLGTIKGHQQSLSVLANPLPVVMAVVQDLQGASSSLAKEAGIVSDGFVLDMHVWAGLNLSYS